MNPAGRILELAEVRRATASGRARDVREAARLSQAEVARAVGVSQGALSRWEAGQRRPRGAAALRYARFLRTFGAESPETRPPDLTP